MSNLFDQIRKSLMTAKWECNSEDRSFDVADAFDAIQPIFKDIDDFFTMVQSSQLTNEEIQWRLKRILDGNK